MDPRDGSIVIAAWLAPKVPLLDKELGYYAYTGAVHPLKSDYLFWASNGQAGCWLRPHIRARRGLPKTWEGLQELLRQPLRIENT